METRDSEPSGIESSTLRERLRACSALAREILSYMARNPNASDTLEGIVEWWLLEHRIRTRAALVRQALEELMAKGLMDQTVSSDRTMYRINSQYRDQLRALDAEPDTEP
jgi:hypothetical protein